ncbi:hypothetical protein LWI29_027410 [Acer saccharum]|uniref:Uncharacterized protein n=1 Tax=Acer saccharum TaxID=4024 RepID=A0AA39VS17_ACESA|nr:hypothetical protein LWI29_027410 [Acer saccharum]
MERAPPTAMMREMMMSMKLWKAVILLRRDGATEKMGLWERKRVAKRGAGISVSNVPHPDLSKDDVVEGAIIVKDKSTIPNVGIEASQGVPANTQPNPVLKSNEEDDDQGTLRDLRTRERHSKNRSDYPSEARMNFTMCCQIIFTNSSSDDSLAEIGIDDFDDASDHLLNHANKILMCSGQLSRTSLEVVMSVFMGGIVMGQTDDANIGQPNVITSRATPEVVAPTIQCHITQAKGVVGIQGTLVATAVTSLGVFSVNFLDIDQPNSQSQSQRSVSSSTTRSRRRATDPPKSQTPFFKQASLRI